MRTRHVSNLWGLNRTNSVERLNEEIRRRDRVIRIYPNRESAVRLIGAVLMELDEKWQSGPKYFDMQDYVLWRQEPNKTSQTQSTNGDNGTM